MSRFYLPPSSPAMAETIEEHVRIGGRWIAAAMDAHPTLLPEAALCIHVKGGPLDPSTVGRYRADLRYALIDVMTDAGRLAEFPAAWEKVDAILSQRKARIADKNKRTSAKKVTDATEEEVVALFRELKRHALKYENPNSILAALFVLVAGHAGFRPIELRGASLVGTTLTLPNAKKRPGHDQKRTMNVDGLHKDVLIGIELMLKLIDNNLSKREFAKWQKLLAGQLQRACERIGIRTLSLYSFRHIAIASWAAAGLSPADIALLCGHLSIRTAHNHYARADKGHKRKAVARPVSLEATEDNTLANKHPQDLIAAEAPRGADAKMADPDFIFEDMPTPVYQKDVARSIVSPADTRRYYENLFDPRDPTQIEHNIRKANQARQEREATRARRGPYGKEPSG